MTAFGVVGAFRRSAVMRWGPTLLDHCDVTGPGVLEASLDVVIRRNRAHFSILRSVVCLSVPIRATCLNRSMDLQICRCHLAGTLVLSNNTLC